jgi:hypothetical protein
METLSLAAPKGYIKSKNPKRKEKKAFTHFRNVNPIYITESQYHRIAIRSPSYNIDFFAALGFPGNKYVYTLVSFFFFFHAIDRYIYIFAVGKENPSSSSKVFHSFFVCATVYFGISNGRIRFCAQRASLTLFLLCILWCHIVCGSETDSLIFLIYTVQSRDCMLVFLFVVGYILRQADGSFLSPREKQKICAPLIII